MEMFLFIVGIVFALMVGSVITYWVIDGTPEDYYFRTVLLMYVVSILICLFMFNAGNIFAPNTHYILLMSSLILLMVFHIFYCWGYVFLCHNGFEWKLLLLIPNLLFDLCMFIDVMFDQKICSIIWSKIINVGINDLLLVLVTLVSCVISSILVNRVKKLKFNDERYLFDRDLFYDVEVNKNNHEFKEIEKVVLEIYSMAKREYISPSKVHAVIKEFHFSNSIDDKIMERLFASNLHRIASRMDLTEFASRLLPEFFSYRSHRTVITPGFEYRTYEALYNEMSKLIELESIKHEKLSKKIDNIAESISNNVSNIITDVKEDKVAKEKSDISAKAIIRELFHTIFTPLSTIKLNCDWLLEDDTINWVGKPKEKLESVARSVELITSVLTAYRELAMLTPIIDSVSGTLTYSRVKAILDALENQFDKKIKTHIDELPESMGNYSANIISILLLPLLQNAFEASPDGAQIMIRHNENDAAHIISIENECNTNITNSNLLQDGFSTKGEGHTGEGLRSVRRIAESVGIAFEIKSYNKNKKVIAKLSLAKQ